jgi:hypothetical protein
VSAWLEFKHQHELENDGEHIPYDQRYWTAQVCLIGHVQNGGCRVIPAERFCECGVETIHRCLACNSNIKGAFRRSCDYIKNPPAGCLKCGARYPWTEAAIDKVTRLIAESSLTVTEKQEARTDLETIFQNAPQAQSAARRTHNTIAKVGGALRIGYDEVVVPLIAETLARIISG